MYHIKYIEDFEQIANKEMQIWLKQENPYIPQKDEESDFIPDEHGWLVVLDETDSIDNLNTGVASIDDIHGVIYWEFVLFNRELDLWLAVVILNNGFGMSVAIPDSLIRDSPLRKTFSDLLEP